MQNVYILKQIILEIIEMEQQLNCFTTNANK